MCSSIMEPLKAPKSKYLKKRSGPLLWIGFSWPKTAEPKRRNNLPLTVTFPGIPCTYMMDHERTKG